MSASARWRAWSTDVHLVVREPELLPSAQRLLRTTMAAVDLAASRFRDDSELARLRPGRQQVSPLLAELLAVAIDAARDSDGLVDPALGGCLRRAGYDTTFPDLPADRPAAVLAPPVATWREIALDGDVLTLPDGVELDLGATAKAWTVDDVAGRLARLGASGVVGIGGDLAPFGALPDDGWPVAVGDPDGPVDVVEVRSPLATSSTARRTWRRAGAVLHHVLDPRTGRPARRCWRTVSVAASTCVAANTASTAAVVLGDLAPSWLQARGLAARLVHADGTTLATGGWELAA